MIQSTTHAHPLSKSITGIARICLFATLLVLVLSPNARIASYADLGSVNNDSSNEASRLWFVELNSAPLSDVDGTFTSQQTTDYLAQLAIEKQAFRNEAKNMGVNFNERYSFSTLFNGLSIDINPGSLSTLSRLSSVKALYPVQTVPIPETTPSSDDPNLLTALAMTGADVAQSELGYTGAGIKVAVMDTGVDYNHPDLGGCFGTGCRVATGYDFVGNAYNADPNSPGYNPVPVPDPDPDDCNGHGTHVAGIVGANGGVKGVAPDVTFGSYRVFGCEGSTTDDVMLAAMERILADNMDVLNMSIGSAFAWPQSPTAAGSDRLVNKGVVVVASIGNSGANGLYSAGAPGVGQKVIGVASFDNTHFNVLSFIVDNNGQSVGYVPMSGSPDPPIPPTSGGSAPVVYVGRGCNADAYLANPSGKIALISRGACTFNEKYQKARTNGAVGVIIHNNAAGVFSGTIAPGTGSIFSIGISLADGTAIRTLLSGGATVTLTWTNTVVSVPNPTGGLISSFSSYGLAADLSLKPDLGAPGGFIRSTYPLEKGGYTLLSGTSMSSPHVAGAVALLLQARPHTSPQLVRDILQNSADPAPWAGNPSLGFLDNVHRQGAGMLDIDDSILTTTQISPGKLALGESETGPATRTLNVQNNGDSDVTYNLSSVGALSTTGSTFSPSFATGFATVAFTQYGSSVSTLTVPAHGQSAVNVTITVNPSLPDKAIYGGYAVFHPVSPPDAPLLRVPYAGFKGDYQSIVALAPTVNGFPWLAKLSGTSFIKQAAGATFTFQTGDIPYILVHLDHQVRRLRAEVFNAQTGQSWFRAFEFQYVERNSAATSFFAFSWDGVTTAGNHAYQVPNGQFIIKLSVEKALGDDSNPAHWETWNSPSFNINRPFSTSACNGRCRLV